MSANVSWSYVCGKLRTDIMSLKIQMTSIDLVLLPDPIFMRGRSGNETKLCLNGL